MFVMCPVQVQHCWVLPSLMHVEEVVLYDDQITREHMEAILVAIVNKETLTLRKFNLVQLSNSQYRSRNLRNIFEQAGGGEK